MYVMMGRCTFSSLFGAATFLVATCVWGADLEANWLDRPAQTAPTDISQARGLTTVVGAPTQGTTDVEEQCLWGHRRPRRPPMPPPTSGVPELDPQSATGAIAFLGGALLIATGRRRRQAQK